MEDSGKPGRSGLHAVDAVIVPYTELPDIAGGWPRPLLDVLVADMDDAVLPCLVDSGAVNTLFPSWIADEAGVDMEGQHEGSWRSVAPGRRPRS